MTNPETPYGIAKRVLDGRGPSSSNGPALQRIVETLARAVIAATEALETARRDALHLAAEEAESDAVPYEASAHEYSDTDMCHSSQVGIAMAAACRSLAGRLRARAAEVSQKPDRE